MNWCLFCAGDLNTQTRCENVNCVDKFCKDCCKKLRRHPKRVQVHYCAHCGDSLVKENCCKDPPDDYCKNTFCVKCCPGHGKDRRMPEGEMDSEYEKGAFDCDTCKKIIDETNFCDNADNMNTICRYCTYCCDGHCKGCGGDDDSDRNSDGAMYVCDRCKGDTHVGFEYCSEPGYSCNKCRATFCHECSKLKGAESYQVKRKCLKCSRKQTNKE